MILGWFVFGDRSPAQEPKKPNPPNAKDKSANLQDPKARGKLILRWTVNFDTKDTKDYLEQLEACGAILGVPDLKGKLMIIRNLKERPVKLVYEDVKKINRIFFVDDNEKSAKSIGDALDLDLIPSQIVVFYPEEFEQNLQRLETEAASKFR